jgi:hypothetical protein
LQNKTEWDFPSLSTQVYAWVKDPFSKLSAQPDNLTLREDEELCVLQSDCILKMRFTNPPLDKFWFSVKEEYPAIHRKSMNILLQFSSSYMCEQAFSCLRSMKSRTEIISFQLKMKSVCLSEVRQRSAYLGSKKQAHVHIT